MMIFDFGNCSLTPIDTMLRSSTIASPSFKRQPAWLAPPPKNHTHTGLQFGDKRTRPPEDLIGWNSSHHKRHLPYKVKPPLQALVGEDVAVKEIHSGATTFWEVTHTLSHGLSLSHTHTLQIFRARLLSAKHRIVAWVPEIYSAKTWWFDLHFQNAKTTPTTRSRALIIDHYFQSFLLWIMYLN